MLRNKIISAYFTSILGVFSGLLTNLWFLKSLTVNVSAEDFGLYSYIFQIASYLIILQLGMDFSVSRQIAVYLGKGEKHNANVSFWELKRFNTWGMLLTGGAILLLALVFYNGIGVDPQRRELATKLILLTGANQLFVFLQRPFASALIGGNFQEVVNITTVVRTISTTLLALVFLQNDFGVLSSPTAELVTQLLANIVLSLLCKRKLTWLDAKPLKRNPEVFKKLFHFALLSSAGGFAWTLEATCDVFFIKDVLHDLKLLAVFVIWWRFPQMFFDLCSRLSVSAIPTFASRISADDGTAKQTLSKILMIVAFFSSLAVVGITFWLPAFIRLWFGEAFYHGQAFQLAFLMGVLVALRIQGNLFAFFLLAAGNVKLTTRLSWVQAAVKLLLGYMLVVRFGITGLVAASCLAASLQVLVYGWNLHKEKFISFSKLAHAGIALLLAAGVSFLIKGFGGNLTLTYIITGAIATVFGWSIVYLGVSAFNSQYRRFLSEGAKRAGAFFSKA